MKPKNTIAKTDAISGKNEMMFAGTREADKTSLYKLAASLGMTANESVAMVEEICSSVREEHRWQENGFALNILLAKRVVHKSVFTISSRLFSQAGSAAASCSTVVTASSQPRLPFSFRVIDVLARSFGFSEKELAYILNITPVQVRERLTRARMLMNGR